MSNKREREKRREERLQEEHKAQSGEKRAKLLQLGAAAVFVVVVVIAVLIVVSGNDSDGGGDVNLEDVSETDALLSGIPQQKLVLGDPKAKVTLVEFGDLQCPACKAYAEEILPPIIEGMVKQGQAKIEFRNFTIIGPESVDAGAAAIAAGNQGRGWQFLEIFYHNQGGENVGFVTDEFLEAVAEGAGVADIDRFNTERKSKALRNQVEKTNEQAREFGFSGTPSFAVEGPGADGGIELIGGGSTQELEEAINGAS